MTTPDHWQSGVWSNVTCPECLKNYPHEIPRLVAPNPNPNTLATLYPHYYKSVQGLTHVDIYRVLQLFEVSDPCLQHAVKKLLVAGGRGAGKDITRDIQEAKDSLTRWQEMRSEERPK